MDKYELRRQALARLVKSFGRGGIAKVSRGIERDPSYVGRLLYPPTKAGAKRIGDDILEAMEKAFPGWLDAEPNRTTVLTSQDSAAPAPYTLVTSGPSSAATALAARITRLEKFPDLMELIVANLNAVEAVAEKRRPATANDI